MSTSDAGASNPENDDSYNRIRLPSDFKSSIYLQIADSSESVPLSDDDDEEEAPGAIQKSPTSGSVKPSGASKLSQSFLSSDFPTPTPEKPNPLEQVPTARDTGAAIDNPSPVRSHELGPTHTNPLGRRISNMISEEDSELEGDDKTVSRQTTASGSRHSGEGKRPKMQGRPSTMRRIGSALKKTISKDTKS
jgi:hypothetical protein